ncbi:hypothetical protein Tco_1390968 [Tanacetum coccineum]
MKKRKTSKDAEPPRSSKSKDSQSSSSKGTKSQPKSSGKSVQEESVFETADTEMPQDQGDDMGNAEDQPNVEAAFKHDCQIAKAEKPPLTFDELMSTPINFSAFFMNHLKIDNLTQQRLVGPTFNLLKGHSRVEWSLNITLKNVAKLSQIDLTGLILKDINIHSLLASLITSYI